MEISSAAKTLTTLGWFDIRFRPLPTYPTGCCTLHPVDSAGSQRGCSLYTTTSTLASVLLQNFCEFAQPTRT
jgi:hypothetical protein